MKIRFQFRDTNKVFIIFKRLLSWLIISAVSPYFHKHNKLHFFGEKHLKDLPDRNVLFVGNHQTYFMDGIAIISQLSLTGQPKFLQRKVPPRNGHIYYIIALETSKLKGFLVKLISYAGAITVERTWKKGEYFMDKSKVDKTNIQRDQDKIGDAIKDGWVVMFPQGTTTPFAPVRKGVAEIIKKYQPVVVPVVVSGFSKAFERSKIMALRERDVDLVIKVKEPLKIDYNSSVDTIVNQVHEGIEQSEKYQIEFESRYSV
ncbi:MAG: 1-acyl-sn-glycerol-3-phosphate acyltransferase [bacterium]|nr:1-acyl-sn-glycerol-3-phosphate acyltransferase [bacterium]